MDQTIVEVLEDCQAKQSRFRVLPAVTEMRTIVARSRPPQPKEDRQTSSTTSMFRIETRVASG